MSQFSGRDTAVYNARDPVKQSVARGIDMPEPVNAAVATLDRVKAARPAQPPTAALRRLILDDATDADISRALLPTSGTRA